MYLVMMDEGGTVDLDALLTRAAPSIAPVTDEVRADLARRAVAAERAVQSRLTRRRRRVPAVAAVAAVGVLGVGGIAAAAGFAPKLLPWASREGTSCGLYVSANLRTGVQSVRFPAEQQQETLAAARAYLSTFDLSSIDQATAREAWFDYLQRVSVGHPSRAELERDFVGESLEVHALIHAVDVDLAQYLGDHGYDARAVDVSVANRCAR